MHKHKFLFAGIISAALVFGLILTNCSEDDSWEGSNTGDISSMKIQDRDAVLGTPNRDPSKAALGSVTIYTFTREDGKLVVKNPSIRPIINPATAKMEYAVTAAAASPDSSAFKTSRPSILTDGDYLWIKVSVDQSAYYVVKITIKYGSANYDPIKAHPASREFTLADWNSASADKKTLSVEMAEESEDYIYQWYSNTVFSNKDGTAITGATSASYMPVITAAGDYYYYVTITLAEETSTSNAAMIKINAAAAAEAETAFKIGDARLNYVRGIGGTGSFMFRTGSGDASPDADVRYIDLLMGELGVNVLRIMVQDDYENYITNSVQSQNQQYFYHNARSNFFPVIRKANEYGGYVFANPWTAPASMKTTGGTAEPSLAGGRLTETGPNYVDYAEHLRKFLKWLNTNNAPIFALGILNEPDFGGGASYEGMGMSATVTRDWFKTVGNFTTQEVKNRESAGTTSSILDDDIIPGYGGGKATHHVLAMSGDSMGNIAGYMNAQLDDPVSNNYIELMGRHYYADATRYTKVVGTPPPNNPTAWKDRPQLGYEGPYEAASLAMSPQMYAPGSKAGEIKREVWQTEHDFNFWGTSTAPPPSNVQESWNSAFAALHDIDWGLRVMGESVFCWWYTSSFSGFVTSYQQAGFLPYTITPRGRAAAHYARYVAETWFLPITQTKEKAGTNMKFNVTGSTGSASTNFNAGAVDPKISAYEDVDGKFITVVMYTPSLSTAGPNGGNITNAYGQGGTNGSNDPTRGSANVGRIAIALPDGFVGSGASAIRTYGNGNATSEDAGWTAAKPVPAGSPRYWIAEPVFLSADGKSVEVDLPAGNVISIMIRGEWTSAYLAANPRYFEGRVRPYTVK
jgi:O-glycosyl hydrolase